MDRRNICYLLYLVLGFIVVTHSSVDLCSRELLHCSPHKKDLLKDGKLFETEVDLQTACRQNVHFRVCILSKLRTCLNSYKLSSLARYLFEGRLIAQDVCQKTSEWNILYLKASSCINENALNSLEVCEEIGSLNVTNKTPINYDRQFCSEIGQVFECEEKHLNKVCGKNAGNLYKRLQVYQKDWDFECHRFLPEPAPTEENMSIVKYILSFLISLLTDFRPTFRKQIAESDQTLFRNDSEVNQTFSGVVFQPYLLTDMLDNINEHKSLAEKIDNMDFLNSLNPPFPDFADDLINPPPFTLMDNLLNSEDQEPLTIKTLGSDKQDSYLYVIEPDFTDVVIDEQNLNQDVLLKNKWLGGSSENEVIPEVKTPVTYYEDFILSLLHSNPGEHFRKTYAEEYRNEILQSTELSETLKELYKLLEVVQFETLEVPVLKKSIHKSKQLSSPPTTPNYRNFTLYTLEDDQVYYFGCGLGHFRWEIPESSLENIRCTWKTSTVKEFRCTVKLDMECHFDKSNSINSYGLIPNEMTMFKWDEDTSAENKIVTVYIRNLELGVHEPTKRIGMPAESVENEQNIDTADRGKKQPLSEHFSDFFLDSSEAKLNRYQPFELYVKAITDLASREVNFGKGNTLGYLYDPELSGIFGDSSRDSLNDDDFKTKEELEVFSPEF